VCEVSARDGDGIENLIEGLLLQADVMELKAARAGQAEVSTILFFLLFYVALLHLVLVYCSLYDIVLLYLILSLCSHSSFLSYFIPFSFISSSFHSFIIFSIHHSLHRYFVLYSFPSGHRIRRMLGQGQRHHS
jgi:hypothetical protein